LFSNLSITGKGLILVLVPVVFELVFLTILSLSLYRVSRDYQRLEHSKTALMCLFRIQCDYMRFVEAVVATKRSSKQQSPAEIAQVASLIKADDDTNEIGTNFPELKEALQTASTIKRQALRYLKIWKKNLSLPDRSMETPTNEESAFAYYFETLSLGRQLVALEHRISRAGPEQIRDFNLRLGMLLVVGGALSLTICVSLAYILSADLVRRLNTIKDNASHLTIGEPLEPIQGGTDEIAQLDEILHRSSQILKTTRMKESVILSNVTDVMCLLDRRLKFADASSFLTNAWKYGREELMGHPLTTVLVTKDPTAVTQEFEKIARTGKAGTVENIVRCKDGMLKNSMWNVSWSDTDSLYTCVVHDVTALRSAQKFRRDLLAMIGHDVRAPLTSISLCLSALEAERDLSLSSSSLQTLSRMRASAGSLMELVEELLRLEKMQAGKIVLKSQYISLGELCTKAVEAVATSAAASGIELLWQGGDAAIFADAEQIARCLWALLVSTIKSSPRGAVVSVSIAHKATTAEARVHDTGTKLTNEECSRLFKGMRGTASAAKRDTERTSGDLSLMTVKSIVDAHGGNVGV